MQMFPPRRQNPDTQEEHQQQSPQESRWTLKALQAKIVLAGVAFGFLVMGFLSNPGLFTREWLKLGISIYASLLLSLLGAVILFITLYVADVMKIRFFTRGPQGVNINGVDWKGWRKMVLVSALGALIWGFAILMAFIEGLILPLDILGMASMLFFMSYVASIRSTEESAKENGRD